MKSFSIFIISVIIICVSLVSYSAKADTHKISVLVQKDNKVQLMSVSPSAFSLIKADESILYLGRPQRVHVANAILREYIGADFVLPGTNHKPDIIPYTGKGVILGIIDCGIDPNHITFMDEIGSSRVKTYIFTTSSEESEDGEFHADVYSTPTEIAASPVDAAEGGHGTHTTATATGSWKGNPYHGVAPDMELFLVGTGQRIYDDEIIYGMQAASDYALQAGKPIVISLSLGSGSGPRDGTSPVGLVSKALAARNHHIFFAAGNDGKRGASIQHNFKSDTTAVRSMFQKYYNGPGHYCHMEAWSSDNKEAELQIMLCHRDTVKYASRWITITDTPADGRMTLLSDSLSGEMLPELRQWLSGEIFAEMGVYEPNDRFRIILDADIDHYNHDTSLPYFAFGIRSRQGADMRIYADPYFNSLVSWENPLFMYGNSTENISDFATSPYVVSVGMLNATESVRTMKGKTLTLESMGFGEVGAPNLYSSRGTTAEGDILPHVLAPGSLVISALYPEAPGMEENYVCDTIINGKRYVWGHDSGTSMATPATAATVALWLEAVPTLTHDQVMDILKTTSNPSVREQYPYHSAYGVIDAYAGLKYALQKYAGVNEIGNERQQKLALRYIDGQASPGARIECLVSQRLTNGSARFIDMTGRVVTQLQFNGTDFITTLPETPGIYILSVTAPGYGANMKIAVK